jgi:hypothetical protein
VSTERELSGRVRSWLREDSHEDANRVLNVVLDQLDTTPQRHASRLARRFQFMNSSTLRFGIAGIAAVAVIAIAVLGIRSLPGNHGSPAPITTPAPTATPTPIPTPTPVPTPIPLSGQASLDGGTYLASVNGNRSLRLTVDVPAGWQAFEDWALSGPNGADAPAGYGLGFWSVANLFTDPLNAGQGTLQPPVGPTVDDLVEALTNHPGWTTTSPTPVTIDGFSGQYLRLTVPADITFQNCGADSESFLMWETPDGGGRCAQGPGQIHDIYVIDVDGSRLVVAALSFPDSPEAGLREQKAIIDSIHVQ